MNHKRKRPRIKGTGKSPDSMGTTPAHHNILFHSRPRRRRDKLRCIKLMQGQIHPDAMAWELGNHKPHTYYW